MNRFLKLLSLCLFLTLTVPLQAITNGVANEPDSVYLFPTPMPTAVAV